MRRVSSYSPRTSNGSQKKRLTCLGWVFYISLTILLCASASIPLLVFYDAAMEELHYTDFSSEATKRVLFVGWTSSLIELSQNWIFCKEMEEICRVYDPTRPKSHGYHEGHEGGVHVHIFFREGDENSMHEVQAVLVQQGCSASFTKEEETIWRYMDVRDKNSSHDDTVIGAKTKSYEREVLLQDNIRYDAVVNMDLDNVISLPSLSSLQHALAHTIANPASIVCANERKTWHLLLRQLRLFLFSHKNDNTPEPSSPQSDNSHFPFQDTDYCSEGFTMYGWSAWSSPKCSFDMDSVAAKGLGKSKVQQLRRQKDPEAHVIFQECLKAQNSDTWIGVQPDLVIWRQSPFPWLLVAAFVLMPIAFVRLRTKATQLSVFPLGSCSTSSLIALDVSERSIKER